MVSRCGGHLAGRKAVGLMKKKWYEKPKTVVASIAAVIVAVGIIWNWIISLVNFSRWPEVTKVIAGEVSKVQEDVVDLKKYVAEQQRANEINAKANELVQKQLEEKKEVIQLPDGKLYYWDKTEGKWLPVKKGK